MTDSPITTPEDYANLDATTLRILCAFKDGTIDIQQNTLRNIRVQLHNALQDAEKWEHETRRLQARIREGVLA